MLRFLAALLGAAVIAAGCGGDGEEAAEERPEVAPEAPGAVTGAGQLDFEGVETLVGGLEVPWGLDFVDERTILVTERPGRVRVVKGRSLRPEPVAEVEVADGGEGGLLGIALHPEFPERRFAYLYYTAADGNRVSRFRVGENLGFREERVLLTIPAGTNHDGGRIAFGPDGLLYVATGETGEPELAADRGSLAGKILRVEPDGDVPADNPFGDSPVYSYGHRNPQGFDWDERGRLYASEHGPTGEDGLCCHDEINLIEAGGFYGWPFRASNSDALEGEPPEQPIAPIADSDSDTWAPAGLVVHEPEGGEANLLVANLVGENLLRFGLGGADAVVGTQPVLDGFGRLRAAELGPGGCLYLTTSNTDGRGSPREGDDRILRVCPEV